jgi:hypothetical protein
MPLFFILSQFRRPSTKLVSGEIHGLFAPFRDSREFSARMKFANK